MKFSPQSTAYLLVSITITTNTSSSSAFVLPPRLISVNSNGSSCAPNENCAPNIKYCGANGITRTRGVCPLASSSSGDNSKDNKADGDIKKNKDVKIVDAVVESSSGLLAEINDEENTSVSCRIFQKIGYISCGMCLFCFKMLEDLSTLVIQFS